MLILNYFLKHYPLISSIKKIKSYEIHILKNLRELLYIRIRILTSHFLTYTTCIFKRQRQKSSSLLNFLILYFTTMTKKIQIKTSKAQPQNFKTNQINKI